MNMDLDTQRIDVPCPRCGHKTNEQIGRLKRDPTIHCAGCGEVIQVEASELRNALAEVQRQLDQLAKTIKGFGKR